MMKMDLWINDRLSLIISAKWHIAEKYDFVVFKTIFRQHKKLPTLADTGDGLTFEIICWVIYFGVKKESHLIQLSLVGEIGLN